MGCMLTLRIGSFSPVASGDVSGDTCLPTTQRPNNPPIAPWLMLIRELTHMSGEPDVSLMLCIERDLFARESRSIAWLRKRGDLELVDQLIRTMRCLSILLAGTMAPP